MEGIIPAVKRSVFCAFKTRPALLLCVKILKNKPNCSYKLAPLGFRSTLCDMSCFLASQLHNMSPLACLQIIDLLLPPDSFADQPAVTMELIAGAGGLEAAMFARDLFKMYHTYAQHQGWRFLVQEGPGGGSRDSLTPDEPLYSKLRWEAGVHRVQRIPTTSKLNKIHTSTVAVTVLPALDELNPEDLEWEFFRASGAGGQHVNKTESAVRVRHQPTGLVAACQTDRSQHANREAINFIACSVTDSCIWPVERVLVGFSTHRLSVSSEDVFSPLTSGL
ncbi:unnamed protein product [Schistocephalus solidus]|uniref:RF_PROK_I domain-containing protein n=1 Tax=Schistocephalus solidus TaxID=70667 RepID=A0A183SHN8_SCHSO|nr:unnamed protein product [Schistocephalus solidus]